MQPAWVVIDTDQPYVHSDRMLESNRSQSDCFWYAKNGQSSDGSFPPVMIFIIKNGIRDFVQCEVIEEHNTKFVQSLLTVE